MNAKSKKIPVAVLGATGTVGQRFIQLLADHPYFEVSAIASSDQSAGQVYEEVTNWRLEGIIPPEVGRMMVQPVEPNLDARLVFSALPAGAAVSIEADFAKAGYIVCSNSSAYRFAEDVPILIPEINPDQVDLIPAQRAAHGWSGLIVTSPNCTSTGIAMPLKPLDEAFSIQQVMAVTMQAISGAGYPGIPAADILANVYPYIKGEEEKVELEPRLLLGQIKDGRKQPHPMAMSAQINRVPVFDGHTASVAVKFERKPSVDEVYQALEDYRAPKRAQGLPTSPDRLFVLHRQPGRPQPRIDIYAENGMAVSVGQVRPCPIFDIKMTTVVHNTLRGAASGSILNAELLVKEGLVG
jgi:aspartate-semialdehyde dehydrogenase